MADAKQQKALLTFMDDAGRFWVATAELPPVRSVDGDETRPYWIAGRPGERLWLTGFKFLVERPRNVHCSNCGDTRGGPVGHEISECKWASGSAADAGGSGS